MWLLDSSNAVRVWDVVQFTFLKEFIIDKGAVLHVAGIGACRDLVCGVCACASWLCGVLDVVLCCDCVALRFAVLSCVVLLCCVVWCCVLCCVRVLT